MDETNIPKTSEHNSPMVSDSAATQANVSDETVVSPVPLRSPSLPRHMEESDLSGMTLGGYRLVRKVAEGGMGVVYEAIQTKLDRKVALKVLTEQLSSLPEFLRRFEREAKAAAALNHPNLVQVHDFGEVGNRYYMIMEFVDGEDLSSYVHTHGKLSVLEGLSVVEQAAHALRTALEKSIIHRDIKPSNLMFTRDRRVKVSDLGLAKVLNESAEMTATGVGIGSPYFIAPEQAADASSVDHRADIYSLGITLLFLLTGQKPFDGNTPYSIVLAHVNKTLPSGAEMGTELPPEVERLIQKMAAKDPEDRYQTYDALLADVELVKAGVMPKAVPARSGYAQRRKVIWGLSAAAAVVIIGLVAMLLSSGKKSSEATTKAEAISTPATLISSAPAREEAGARRMRDTGDTRLEAFPMSPSSGPRREGPEFRGRGGAPGGMRLPMGGPPAVPPFSPLQDGSVEAMMKEAQELAANNEGNYILLLHAYEQIAEKVRGTPGERMIRQKIDETVSTHTREAQKAIELHTAKMKEALRTGDAQAAFDSWSSFPSNLRNREVDNQIRQILTQSLPSGFSPL